jgi:hypothetical protein
MNRIDNGFPSTTILCDGLISMRELARIQINHREAIQRITTKTGTASCRQALSPNNPYTRQERTSFRTGQETACHPARE